MNRLQEKYGLFSKLGALFGPLQRLVEHPEQYNEQERAQTIARFCDEYPKLKHALCELEPETPIITFSNQQKQILSLFRTMT